MSSVRFKVCGITRVGDACIAAEAGASYLGFIFYAKSPRSVSIDQFEAMRNRLPDVPKVAVLVEPQASDLNTYFEAGFDYVQIHFDQNIDRARVRAWSEVAGAERLVLAPKIKPGQAFDKALLSFAGAILWDGYKKDPDAYGGTGHTSDWGLFAELQEAYPATRWMLAGGLKPEIVKEVVASTRAKELDFNSGVESSPGVKDHDKVRAIALELNRVAENRNDF